MSASGLSFLFINVSRIGDTLFATPAMRAVENAYPGCRMVVLGHPKRFDILRGMGQAVDLNAFRTLDELADFLWDQTTPVAASTVDAVRPER